MCVRSLNTCGVKGYGLRFSRTFAYNHIASIRESIRPMHTRTVCHSVYYELNVCEFNFIAFSKYPTVVVRYYVAADVRTQCKSKLMSMFSVEPTTYVHRTTAAKHVTVNGLIPMPSHPFTIGPPSAERTRGRAHIICSPYGRSASQRIRCGALWRRAYANERT